MQPLRTEDRQVMPPAASEAKLSDVLPSPLSGNERTLKNKQIAQLKQELAATKEYLQSIIKALESANEELRSANEEIQSGNDELQSTNEELQRRDEMLMQLNNDLNNLLNSVNLPMVMVGPDLSIRRYTPQAARVLGLKANDVGRPITRLRLSIEVAALKKMMIDVISGVRSHQCHVKDSDGGFCSLRLTPYRTADNRIDGVVLSVLSFDKVDGDDNRPRKQGAAQRGNARNSRTNDKLKKNSRRK
jgi:two-component system CheB/CheR fusion protein